MNNNIIEDRITELEIRLTHYEDTLEQLDQMIISQRNEIGTLQVQIEHLNKKLKSAQTSPVAHESEETPPPHY